MPPDLALVNDPAGRPRLTWIGHASFLLSLDGVNLLVDPVLAPRTGLVYRRFDVPGLSIDQMPAVAAVLVTHNHFDHLDTAVMASLPEVRAIVPTGVGRWLPGREVAELGWWDSTEVAGVRVTLVPARHWSRRRIGDTNRTLWGGFVIEGDDASVYHAGDTAWFDGFADIGRRFPGLSAAVLPIGGYAPAWFMEHNHMSPEQAGRAFLACGARLLVPMHWGAFRLSDEPLAEPAERLRAWWTHDGPRDGRGLALLAVGATVVLGER